MKQSNHIPIYHIEDDEDWQEIVGKIVTRLPFNYVEYVPLKQSFEKSLREITNSGIPGIVVLDLRLDEPLSEYLTVVELHQVKSLLNSHLIEIIILSGYIGSAARYLLVESGIPNDHIFGKGSEFIKERDNFIEILKNLITQVKEGTPNNNRKSNIIPAPVKESGVVERINKLEVSVAQGFDEIKRGQAFLYRQLSPSNQNAILKILEQLKQGRIRQHHMEQMLLTACNAMEIIKDTKSIDDSQIMASLEKIYSAINAGTELQQQFELVLPIIPFLLEYKISLGGGVDLGAAWDEFVNRVKKGKSK